MAIYLTIKHFRYFVEGRTFAVFIDYAPLCKALFSRSQTSLSRQQRHLGYIAQFTSDPRYVKDEENGVADCLSRITAFVFKEFEAVDFLEMAASQQRDPVINHLQKTPNALKLEHQLIPNKDMFILGDVSTGSFRILVPSEFLKKIFDGIHSLSHAGIKGIQSLISKRCVWLGCKADIKQWCQTCITCQQSKIHKHTILPLQRIPPSSRKFQHVHFELVGPILVSDNTDIF